MGDHSLHGCDRKVVKHSQHEYVRGWVHINGIVGMYYMSEKHLHCYLDEFTDRHNNHRGLDTLGQMAALTKGMDQKRLKYEDLIA